MSDMQRKTKRFRDGLEQMDPRLAHRFDEILEWHRRDIQTDYEWEQYRKSVLEGVTGQMLGVD